MTPIKASTNRPRNRTVESFICIKNARLRRTAITATAIANRLSFQRPGFLNHMTSAAIAPNAETYQIAGFPVLEMLEIYPVEPPE